MRRNCKLSLRMMVLSSFFFKSSSLVIRPLCLAASQQQHAAFSKVRSPITGLFSGQASIPEFLVGDKIQVEVVSFGPLGASVDVIGIGHGDGVDLLPENEDPYGTGLVLQKEIAYFRQSRNNLDVVLGEILPGFVQTVRDDGKLNIDLRPFGGKAKAKEITIRIMERLGEEDMLPIGDKSSPKEISGFFPGVSKKQFKNAIGQLYKKGLLTPGAHTITKI